MAEATKRILIPNTTQVPNLILDLLIPRLPEGEARCLLYICRRTFGFHKEEDRISFSQFQNGIKSSQGRILDLGTGLSRTSINRALGNLVCAGAATVVKSAKGSRYKLNLLMDVEKVVNKVYQLRKSTASSQQSVPALVNKVYPQKKGKKEKQSFADSVDKTAQLSSMRENLARRMTLGWTNAGAP